MWELQQQCQCGILLIHGLRADLFLPCGKRETAYPTAEGVSRGRKVLLLTSYTCSLLVTLETKKSQEEREREAGVQRSPKGCVRVEEKVWPQRSKSSLP